MVFCKKWEVGVFMRVFLCVRDRKSFYVVKKSCPSQTNSTRHYSFLIAQKCVRCVICIKLFVCKM